MPVAVNLYKVRQDRGPAGTLFQSVQRQKPQYQGIWIVSPDGKVLAAHHEIKSHATWPQEVRETLDAGLKAFGEVTTRQVKETEPLPHRGVGALSDGGVCLALYSRCVRGGGRESAPSQVNPKSLWLWDGPVKPDGPPVIDSVSLTAAEWAHFLPKKGAVGEEWSLPEAVVRKLARALSPSSDQSTMPRPEEAQVAELKARVESVQGARITVRLSGRLEAKRIYLDKPSYGWAAVKGTLVLEQKQPRILQLAFLGAYRMAPPYDNADRPVAAVVEWRRE